MTNLPLQFLVENIHVLVIAITDTSPWKRLIPCLWTLCLMPCFEKGPWAPVSTSKPMQDLKMKSQYWTIGPPVKATFLANEQTD